jgi:hypothetical protein
MGRVLTLLSLRLTAACVSSFTFQTTTGSSRTAIIASRRRTIAGRFNNINNNRNIHRFELPPNYKDTNICSTGGQNNNEEDHDGDGGAQDSASAIQETDSSFLSASSAREGEHDRQRRRLLQQMIVTATTTAGALASVPALALAATATTKVRAKGAAEYDLEYYMRDLFQGNQPQGNQPASPPPASYTRPPRILSGPLILPIPGTAGATPSQPLPLLDSDCLNCIIVDELVRVTRHLTPTNNNNEKIDAALISQLTQDYRSRALRNGYGAYKPYQTASMTDEYYLDVTAYALWKTASSDAILGTNYKARNVFMKNVGRRIYAVLKQEQPPQQQDENNANSKSKSPLTLTSTLPVIQRILQVFQDSNLIASYRLGPTENYNDPKNITPLFDKYDDQDFVVEGATLNALVSVFEPATLGAALQITGEGSRFAPDFVGFTLAAAFEDMLNTNNGNTGTRKVDVSLESYFVDSTYRPNPKDYFPDEQLLQFTISSR